MKEPTLKDVALFLSLGISTTGNSPAVVERFRLALQTVQKARYKIEAATREPRHALDHSLRAIGDGKPTVADDGSFETPNLFDELMGRAEELPPGQTLDDFLK